jgi:hypothetical protein
MKKKKNYGGFDIEPMKKNHFGFNFEPMKKASNMFLTPDKI